MPEAGLRFTGATFDKLGNRPGVKKDPGSYRASDANDEIFNVEDFASAMVRYDNGMVLSIEAAFSLNLKQDTGTIEMFGTKAGAKLSPELEIFTNMNGYMTNVQLTMPTALSFEGLFENEINHLLEKRHQIEPAQERFLPGTRRNPASC